MGLRDLLVGGATPARANRLFTNRVSEAQAYLEAIDRVAASNAEPGSNVTIDGPRRNVLAFYGHGGVGKSALSRHLQSGIEKGEIAAPRDTRPISLRIDLAKTSVRDLDSVLIAIRSRLAAESINAPAFDIAFLYYWTQKNPGVALSEYLRPRSSLVATGDSLDLGSVIQDAAVDTIAALSDAATFGGAGATFRLSKSIAATVAARLSRSRTLKDCSYLAMALEEQDMEMVRAFLAHFLAWDIGQASDARGRPLLTVFFDSWEDVQSSGSARGCLEDELSQLIYLMPNVLFVVTGREQLRWGSATSSARLLRHGPTPWPGLVTDGTIDTDQHLLGTLSTADSERFLRGATEAAPLGDELLFRVIESSGGHPDYLDAVVDLWQAATARGESLELESVSGSIEQVYERQFRGLSGVERDLLLGASLVPAFDEGMLGLMVPQASRTQIAAFVARHLIEPTMSAWLGFRLRPTISGLLRASRQERGWSWGSSQVDAVMAKVGEYILDASLPTDEQPKHETNNRLDQAVKIFVDLDARGMVLPTRTAELIFAANSGGSSGRLTDDDYGDGSSAFGEVMLAVNRLETAVLVAEPPASEKPAWLADVFLVSRARRQLLDGLIEDAEATTASISDSVPIIARRHEKLLVLIDSRAGRIVSARDRATRMPVGHARSDLLGHAAFWQGSLPEAQMLFTGAAIDARARRADLSLARALRHQALIEVMLGKTDAMTMMEEAREANRGVGSRIGLAQMVQCDAILAARTGQQSLAVDRLEFALEEFTAVGAANDVLKTYLLGVLTARLAVDNVGECQWSARLTAAAGSRLNGRLYTRTASFIQGMTPSDDGIEDDYDDLHGTRDAWASIASLKVAVTG